MDWVNLASMDQQKVPTASPGRNEQGSTLSIRIPAKLWEFLDRARLQFSDPVAETLSISEVTRRMLETAAQNRLSGGRQGDKRSPRTTDRSVAPDAPQVGRR